MTETTNPEWAHFVWEGLWLWNTSLRALFPLARGNG